MDDRSHEVLAVAILFLVTSWITVGLRVYVRAGMLKTFGSDDWAMVATLVSVTEFLQGSAGTRYPIKTRQWLTIGSFFSQRTSCARLVVPSTALANTQEILTPTMFE